MGLSLYAQFDDKFLKNAENALKEVHVEVNLTEMQHVILNFLLFCLFFVVALKQKPECRNCIIIKFKLRIALIILAVLGAGLLICGFLGCCGACCENTCLLGLVRICNITLYFNDLCNYNIFVPKSRANCYTNISFSSSSLC